MTKEIWKDIQGYEGLYQVSTLGRVKSLDFEKHFYPMERKPYTKILKGQMLSPYFNAQGFLVVKLYKGKECKIKVVHRLVAIAFVKNPLEYKKVKFKDGDRSNVKMENLKWC